MGEQLTFTPREITSAKRRFRPVNNLILSLQKIGAEHKLRRSARLKQKQLAKNAAMRQTQLELERMDNPTEAQTTPVTFRPSSTIRRVSSFPYGDSRVLEYKPRNTESTSNVKS